MQYSFGAYILDTHKKIIVLKDSQEVITNNERMIEAMLLMIKAHPETVSKSEFLEKLWSDASVTDWALSRLIADIRQLLAPFDKESAIIKTVHRKGFRIGVEIEVIEESKDTQQNETEVIDAPPLKNPASRPIKKLLPLIVLVLIVLILGFSLIFSTEDVAPKLADKWESEEMLASAYDFHAPTVDWWSNVENAIAYKDNQIILSPTEDTQKFTFQFDKPAYIQNSQLFIRLKADKDFISSNSWIQLYAQVAARGNWIGEWQCPSVNSNQLTEEFSTLSCVIRIPSEYWKQEVQEYSKFGINVQGKSLKGKIIVESAKIHFPISINLDKEWRPNPTYDRGVSYSPVITNDPLARTFKGPIDLRNHTLIFTIKPDKEFIDSGANLQPYLFKVNEHNGLWNCLIENSKLQSSGFTFECPILDNENHFLLDKDDYLIIGIQPYGEKISGSIKILNISILSPEEMEARSQQSTPGQ